MVYLALSLRPPAGRRRRRGPLPDHDQGAPRGRQLRGRPRSQLAPPHAQRTPSPAWPGTALRFPPARWRGRRGPGRRSTHVGPSPAPGHPNLRRLARVPQAGLARGGGRGCGGSGRQSSAVARSCAAIVGASAVPRDTWPTADAPTIFAAAGGQRPTQRGADSVGPPAANTVTRRGTTAAAQAVVRHRPRHDGRNAGRIRHRPRHDGRNAGRSPSPTKARLPQRRPQSVTDQGTTAATQAAVRHRPRHDCRNAGRSPSPTKARRPQRRPQSVTARSATAAQPGPEPPPPPEARRPRSAEPAG